METMMGNSAHAFSDRAQRFTMAVPLHFREKGLEPWMEAQIVNISQTGILFRTDETVPADTRLEVRVDFPAYSHLDCQCTVVRTEPSLLAVQIQDYNLVHS
jgi:hypothetical protein